MAKRKPPSAIKDAVAIKAKTPANFQAALSSQDLLDEYTGISQGSFWGMNYTDIGGPGVSGRPGLTQGDYEYWRPDEKTSFRNPKDAMMAAERAYDHNGIVHNVIDIMGDFACQGIRLVHPNKRTERFFQNWWKKVSGEERSERFLNNLYKLGNVCVRMQMAKLSDDNKTELYKATAADIEVKDYKYKKNEIPWKYTFYHPVTIDVVGGPLSNFSKTPKYYVKVPEDIKRTINKANGVSANPNVNSDVVEDIPHEILDAAIVKQGVEIPGEYFRVFHYKKDDWKTWSQPMIGSILIDVSLYEKMKLADRAALDGAISNIRLWTMGDIEKKIAPSAAEMAKLASVLQSNTNGGVMDLIWGPTLKMTESTTQVHKFLGMAKYEPTLMAIYGGLGIPPTLTGTFGASGTTNNFISLKTLTQRLQYGRSILMQFWNEQIEIVQKAMGFRLPASIEFDMDNLGDEIAEKSLLIQLSDRNLISDELLQLEFGHDPVMEAIRIKQENEERKDGDRLPKAGNFHDPQTQDAMNKMGMQVGLLSTKEAGLTNVPDRRVSLPQDMPQKTSTTKTKKGGAGGRPINKKDSKKRKTKRFTPKIKAQLQVWADNAQNTIGEILNPFFLEKYDKKNLRGLSKEEFEESENIKFGVLCSLEPMSTVDEPVILTALANETPDYIWATYQKWEEELKKTFGRNITLEERKSIQSSIYTLKKEEDING